MHRIILAIMLMAAVTPAQAASRTAQKAKDAWSVMDQCTKAARDRYPDTTADSLAKRDAFVHTCQRDARVPMREGQAPKK